MKKGLMVAVSAIVAIFFFGCEFKGFQDFKSTGVVEINGKKANYGVNFTPDNSTAQLPGQTGSGLDVKVTTDQQPPSDKKPDVDPSACKCCGTDPACDCCPPKVTYEQPPESPAKDKGCDCRDDCRCDCCDCYRLMIVNNNYYNQPPVQFRQPEVKKDEKKIPPKKDTAKADKNKKKPPVKSDKGYWIGEGYLDGVYYPPINIKKGGGVLIVPNQDDDDEDDDEDE